MKKVMDKLLNIDRKTLIFLFIISFIGILTGALFMTVLDATDKTLVTETLDGFLGSVEPINYVKYLTENLIVNILSLLTIWILGLSVIGIPVVIIFIFMKSFIVSFSLSSFIANYHIKGTFLGLAYNFPHHFINLVVFLYLGVYAIRVSSLLLNSILKRKSIDFKAIMNRYLLVLLVATLIIVVMTIFETFLTPYLLKFVLSVL